MWCINRIVAFLIVGLFILSCGTEEITNADRLVGLWQVRAENKVRLNGEIINEFVEKNWVRFDELNTGEIFDEFENPISEMRWSYEKRETQDRMLIFDKLGGSNSFGLYTDEYYNVMEYNDNNFVLYNQSISEIGDSTYKYSAFSFFVRQ